MEVKEIQLKKRMIQYQRYRKLGVIIYSTQHPITNLKILLLPFITNRSQILQMGNVKNRNMKSDGKTT